MDNYAVVENKYSGGDYTLEITSFEIFPEI